MTARDDLDRQLVAWLTDDALTSPPDHLLGDVLARTARTKRRPAWRVPERWVLMSAIASRTAAPFGVPIRVLAVAVVLALALVVGTILIAGAPHRKAPPPFGPAANGALLYSSGGDIMAADSPTAIPRPILGGADFDNGPLLSPDGTRLAFVRGPVGDPAAELWTSAADGAAPRLLTKTPAIGWAEWSPQSDAIAVLLDGSPSTIRIVDVRDGSVRELDSGLASVESVLWRPTEGAQLSFRAKDTAGDWGIYLINRDGTGRRRLDLDSGFQADATYSSDAWAYFQGPAWSSDGTRLLYFGPEPAPGSPAGPGYRNHVATVDATGTVTADRVVEFDATTDDEFGGTWLGGDSILYQTTEGTEHRLFVSSVAEGHGPARDLGVTARDWITTIVSPDQQTAILSMPVASGSPPDLRTLDLKTGAVKAATLTGDDVTWQRVAAP